MTKPITLTDSNFQGEIASGLTLVDFWAPWCGPCRIIAPVIEELAGQYEGRVKVGKVNVDENPMTQGQFRVMSIPTLILFKDGQPVESIVGAQPKRAFEALLDRHSGAVINPPEEPIITKEEPAITKPVTLTDSNFTDEVSSGLTLVDFWAPWCGPCRIVAPVIEELAGQYEGRVKVGKVNVDENPMTQGQFRVMSIPTLILFKDGQPVESIVGAQPRRAFEKLLDKHAGAAASAN